MDRVINFLKNNKFNILLCACYLFMGVILLCNHEIWRDEAQAWCIARDCNLLEIFQSSRLEGHPMLWYLVLLPFAKLGFPVESMQIVSLLFVFASVIFFLFKSKFNNYIKTVVVLSSGMLYYLPIISRNYALIPLFLFLLADLYKQRHEKPLLYVLLLILLSNTHILMLGFCAIVAFLFVVELIKKYVQDKENKNIGCILLLALNFLFLFFSFYGMQNENHAVAYYGKTAPSFYESVIRFADIFYLFQTSLVGGKILLFLFWIILLSFPILLFRQNKKLASIFTFSFLYQYYVYYKIWYSGIYYQKAFLLLIIMLFVYWAIPKEENVKTKSLNVIISIMFTLSFLISFFVSYLEINYPYSASKQISNYIKTNLKDEKVFVAVSYPFLLSPISAYLPNKKFFSYKNNYYVTYYTFSFDKEIPKEAEPDATYYIVNKPFNVPENFELIFETSDDIISFGEYNEVFRIYKKH